MRRLLLYCLALGAVANAACIAVDTDQIRAADVAKADPAFLTVFPSLSLSYAPTAGHQRTITAAELDRWALTNHIESQLHQPLCFERATQFLSATVVADVIHATALEHYPDAHLKVIDVCQCSTPAGKVEFPLSGAAAATLDRPDMPTLWHGRVVSPEGQTYPIWARVLLTNPTTLVRARRNLQQGQMLTDADLEEVSAVVSPLAASQPDSKASYVGKTLARPVSLHRYLQNNMVETTSAVRRGSLVEIAVTNGGTVLNLQAKAEANANPGEEATFTNPSGLRHFQAIVTGPGKAEIRLGAPAFRDKPENNPPLATTSNKGIL